MKIYTVKEFGIPPPLEFPPLKKIFAHFPSSPLEFPPPRKKCPYSVGWGGGTPKSFTVYK